MYDYKEAMINDIKNYINDNDIVIDDDFDRDDLCSELWVDDSVTGNASGSYTFCRNTAKEYVLDNMDLLAEALDDFGTSNDVIGDHFILEDWEWFDVTIRCYLLDQCIDEVIEELIA